MIAYDEKRNKYDEYKTVKRIVSSVFVRLPSRFERNAVFQLPREVDVDGIVPLIAEVIPQVCRRSRSLSNGARIAEIGSRFLSVSRKHGKLCYPPLQQRATVCQYCTRVYARDRSFQLDQKASN